MSTTARPGGTRPIVATAVLLLVALFGSACSDANASEGTATTAIEPVAGLTVENDLSGQNVQAAAISPTANDVNTLYQDYLDASSRVVTGDAGPDVLSGLTTAAAAQQVLDQYDANEVLRRDGKLSTINQLQVWANIAGIEEGNGTLTVIDCAERHEINRVDQFNVYFVQQQVTIDTSAENWVVADVQVMHNGFYEDGRQFGCIPPDLAKRSETAAIDAWSEFTRISRDPSLIENGLSDRFGPPLGPEVEEYLTASNEGGWVLASEEQVEFHVLGVDTELSLVANPEYVGKTVIVASCHTFPDGRTRTNTVSGEIVEQLAPGAVETQWIYVTLDTKPTSDPTHLDRVQRIVHKGEGCNPFG